MSFGGIPLFVEKLFRVHGSYKDEGEEHLRQHVIEISQLHFSAKSGETSVEMIPPKRDCFTLTINRVNPYSA
jgi:hypothetical protein